MPAFLAEIPDARAFERLIACREACPVGTDARGYVQAVARGDFALAYRIARGPNPFATICGRVCGAPCEKACRRRRIDRPVSIRAIKRAATERHGAESGADPASILVLSTAPGSLHPTPRPKRVAVVGAGVAGLTCAHDLARLGYRVTVFTDWVVGHAHMAVLGAFSFFAIAGSLWAIPRMTGRKLHSTGLANTSFWLMLTGGLLYFVALWIGGFIQGLQWNDASIPFIDTVTYQIPYWSVRVVGGLLIFSGVILFFYNIVRTFTGEPREPEPEPAVQNPIGDANAGILQRLDFSSAGVAIGALVFFLVGGLLTTLLPSIIEDSWAKPLNAAVGYSAIEQRGRDIYVREGCWYCHTQQIRTLQSDVERYGWREVDAPISLPGEYTADAPHLLGTRRTGPDLARVGGKYDTDWHKSHFNNPRDQVPGSVMPPFTWITADPAEFEALVAYMQKLGRARDWRPDDDYEQ